jgi:hypothetical protein
MSKLILDHVTTAMDEMTRVQFALRRGLAGRQVLSNEAMYKHTVNALDEIEQARIELARRIVRQPQPQEVAD